MIKKIKINELKIGMYIHDFNCSWVDHPFFTNSLKISNQMMMEKVIKAGIRELYIDTSKGLDTDLKTDQIPQSPPAPLKKKKKPVSVAAEIGRAVAIKKEAQQAVTGIMDDIKTGKPINTDKAENVVENIMSSVFRNQDALVSLLRIKQADEYTYMHSVSSCVLLSTFCNYLDIDKKLIREVAIGGLLHDIGKMRIPDTILNKPGKLSDIEYKLMKGHVKHGLNIIEQKPGINPIVMNIIAQHHERLDGSGYPNGLQGNEISKFGQMAAIVDIYDAMTSERCYRGRLQPTVVLKKIFEWGKSHFDKELVQQFIQCIGIYPVGTLVRLENGYLAVIINRGSKDMLHPTIRVIYNTKKEHYIQPYEIDLSKKSVGNGNSKIVGYESPDKWQIDTGAYL